MAHSNNPILGPSEKAASVTEGTPQLAEMERKLSDMQEKVAKLRSDLRSALKSGPDIFSEGLTKMVNVQF